MYIFTPGAGCTGPTKLVKPRDELIFNSSYNPSDWTMDKMVASGYKESKLQSTCPSQTKQQPAACEFKVPLPKEDLVELSHKNFSADTMRQI